MKALTTELGLHEFVHFLGWRIDIAAVHRTVDVYVHSALWEGPPLPLAIMEAMASGLPTVLTDCVGWPEGFEQKVHGMVVKAGDAGELADAITWIGGLSREERIATGKRAQDLVQRDFDIASVGQKFVALCAQSLETIAKE